MSTGYLKCNEKLPYLHKISKRSFQLFIKIWDSVYTSLYLEAQKYSPSPYLHDVIYTCPLTADRKYTEQFRYKELVSLGFVYCLFKGTLHYLGLFVSRYFYSRFLCQHFPRLKERKLVNWKYNYFQLKQAGLPAQGHFKFYVLWALY